MLSVYDIRANGEVDPELTAGPVVLSWRLGSDRSGADQTSFRVRVTSLADGEGVWDSGVCEGADNEVAYGGVPLEVGCYYVWFVEVCDSCGQLSCSSPGAFRVVDERRADAISRCMGVLFCPETSTNETYTDSDLRFLDEGPWQTLLGVRLASATRLEQKVALSGPSLVQGSFLAPRGLVVSRVTRGEASVVVEVSLPPGMEADVSLGETRTRLASGRSRIEVPIS